MGPDQMTEARQKLPAETMRADSGLLGFIAPDTATGPVQVSFIRYVVLIASVVGNLLFFGKGTEVSIRITIKHDISIRVSMSAFDMFSIKREYGNVCKL